MSKATFNAIDHHAWGRLAGWIRRKHHLTSRKQLRRRFCDRGWRFAHNGVVFTGASSVAVTRYRYRGSEHPDPLDPQPPPAAEQRARHVESRMRGDTHVRFGGGHGKRTRGNPDTAPVPDLTR